MPAPLADVDWAAVRATFAATGSLKEAAIAHGIEEPTVRQRAHREGWKIKRNAALEASGKIVVSRGVTQPHKAVTSAISAIGDKSRVYLAKAVKKGAQAACRLKGDKILDKAANLKALADTGDKIHQWSGQATAPTLRLELIAGSVGSSDPAELPAIDVEAEVSREGLPSIDGTATNP